MCEGGDCGGDCGSCDCGDCGCGDCDCDCCDCKCECLDACCNSLCHALDNCCKCNCDCDCNCCDCDCCENDDGQSCWDRLCSWSCWYVLTEDCCNDSSGGSSRSKKKKEEQYEFREDYVPNNATSPAVIDSQPLSNVDNVSQWLQYSVQPNGRQPVPNRSQAIPHTMQPNGRQPVPNGSQMLPYPLKPNVDSIPKVPPPAYNDVASVQPSGLTTKQTTV